MKTTFKHVFSARALRRPGTSSRYLAALALPFLAASVAQAATITWSNAGTTDFNLGTNWIGNLAPGAGDNATFTGVAVVNPNLTASTVVQGLTFSTATSSGYILSATPGFSLTLTNSGTGTNATSAIFSASTAAAANTISANLNFQTGSIANILLTQTATAGTGSLNISGNITTTTSTGISLNGTGTNNASAALKLSGTNTFAGNFFLGRATVIIASANALSSGDLVTGNAAASSGFSTFDNGFGSALTLANNGLVVGNTTAFTGTNSLTFNGTSSIGAALNVNGANTLGLAGATTMTAASTITVNTGATLVVGAINWGAFQAQKSGAGKLVLNGPGSGTGLTTQVIGTVPYSVALRTNAGTLEVGNPNAFSTGVVDIRGITFQGNTDLTGANKLTNTFVIATGSPIIGGASNLEFGGNFILSNGANNQTVTVTNSGTTKWTGPVSLTDLAGDAQTLTVSVAATAGATEISGVIQDTPTGSATGSFTKSGAGLLTLSGNNTFTGSLTITAGKLNVTGTNAYFGPTTLTGGTLIFSGAGAINSSGGITISGSSASFIQTSSVAATPFISLTQGTLDGTGKVGDVSISPGAGNVVANGNAGTSALPLTANSLTFSGSGAFSFTLAGGANTAAPILVTNSLSISGGPGSVVLNATTLGSLVVGTTYNLIHYGSFSGDLTAFAKGNFAGLSIRQLTFHNDTVNDLITFTFNGGVADSVKWTGGDSNSWQPGLSGTNKNWQLVNAHTATDYIQGDDVVFDDTAAGNTAISIDALVLPSSMTFNNSVSTYSFTSAGGFGIAGPSSLIKNGSGTVTLNTPNTYAGGTTVNAGTLNINNFSALGTGPLTIAGASFLDNTGGGANFLSTNNTQNWNADFTFIGTNDGTHDLNMGNGNVILGGTGTVRKVTVSAGTFTVGTIVGGAFSFTKDGAGSLALTPTAASSITGTLTIANGVLSIGGQNFSANGLTGTGTITGANGLLLITNAAAATFAGTLMGSVGYTKLGTGKLTLSGTNSYSGETTLTAGTLTAASPTAMGNTLRLNVSGTASATMFIFATDGGDNTLPLGVSTGVNLTIVSDRATPGAAVNRTMAVAPNLGWGGGTLTFTSGPNVTSGTPQITFATIGLGSGFAAAVTVLNPTGVNLSIGDVSKFNNNPAQTLQLDGTTTGNIISGNISNGSAVISVVKSNTSTWTLTGNSTYTGTTTVSAGILNVGNGGFSGALGTGAVTDNAVLNINRADASTISGGLNGGGTLNLLGGGTTTLAGAGNFSGAANITASQLSLAGSVGTLNSLTFTGGGLSVNVNTNLPASPGLVVTTLTANGSVVLNASPLGVWILNSTYSLLTYTGSIGGAGFSAFTQGTVTGLSSRDAAAISNVGNKIILTVTGAALVWTGRDDASWATGLNGTLKNWKLQTTSAATDFIDNDQVIFDDSGTNTTVNISGSQVNAGGIVFNNSALAYTITGSGIASGAVAKNGSGTVTLTTSNNYAGGTTLNAGLLSINNSAALGVGPLNLNGGTLDNTGGLFTLPNNPQVWGGGFTYAGTSDLNLGTGAGTLIANSTINVTTGVLTLGGVISGTGSTMTKAGAGTLSLTAASTYTGGTIVNNGLLTLGVGGGAGTIRGPLTINNGGIVNALVTDALGFTVGSQVSTLTVNAGGIFDNLSATNQGFTTAFVLNGGTVQSTGGGPINFSDPTDTGNPLPNPGISTLAGSTASLFTAPILIRDTELTIDLAANSVLTISSIIGGGARTLNVQDAGTLVLSGTNTYSSGTNFNGGVLSLGSTGALGTTGTLGFGGGALQFTATNSTDYSARFSTAANQQYKFDTNGLAITLATGLSSAGGSLTKVGAGTLVLTGAANFSGTTTVSAGQLNYSGGVSHSIGKVTGAGTFQVDAATTVTSDGVTMLTGTWIINGSQVVRSSASGGAYTTFAAGNSAAALSGTSDVSSLIIGTGAHLDLKNNALIVEATAANKAALLQQIVGEVTSGTITSSTAATNPFYGLIVADNKDLGAVTFGGLAVDANSIIVTQALLGDANLDGVVNPTDLLIYAHNFNNTGSFSVASGDFNIDGVVNPTDLLIYAHNFNNNIGGGAPSLASGGGLISGASATPEPASLCLLALGAVGLLTRRRSRRAS